MSQTRIDRELRFMLVGNGVSLAILLVLLATRDTVFPLPVYCVLGYLFGEAGRVSGQWLANRQERRSE